MAALFETIPYADMDVLRCRQRPLSPGCCCLVGAARTNAAHRVTQRSDASGDWKFPTRVLAHAASLSALSLPLPRRCAVNTHACTLQRHVISPDFLPDGLRVMALCISLIICLQPATLTSIENNGRAQSSQISFSEHAALRYARYGSELAHVAVGSAGVR